MKAEDLIDDPSSNWGRWGDDDEKGTLNLLTPHGVQTAASLVKVGRVVPMGRTVDPSSSEDAALLRLERREYPEHPEAGAVVETYRFTFHGRDWTHLDGLTHVWDAPGLWNGRNPDDEVGDEGVSWADVTEPARGMVARGVLFDVLSWRDRPVTIGRPVTADELRGIASAFSTAPKPGDMIAIRSGRAEWETTNGPYGAETPRPGLDHSVLEYISETDCSVLISDMLDAKPSELQRHWGAHAALYQLGVYLIDNAELTEVGATCRELDTYEFMVVIAPLAIAGATSSPLNPIALF